MSLKYKISLSVILIISLIIASSMYFLQDNYSDRAVVKINEQFNQTKRVFNEYFSKNTDLFAMAISITTYGSTFSENVSLYEGINKNNKEQLIEFSETMDVAIGDAHQGTGEIFDMMIVLDNNFNTIAYFNALDTVPNRKILGQNFEEHGVIQDLYEGGEGQIRTLKIGDDLFQAYADVDPNENGFVITGQRIDNFLADDLEQKLGSNVTFISDKRVLGTSLQRQVRIALENHLSKVDDIATFVFADSVNATEQVTLNNERFLLSFVPVDEADLAYYVIAVSLDKEFATFKGAQFIVLLVGAGAIIIGIIFSFLFGNSITKPVGKLVDAVLEIEKENYNVEVKVESKDEIGILAKNFNEMAKGIGERFELLKFVSKNTAQMIQDQGVGNLELGGVRKHLTMFFSDIRGFTAFSEKRQPEEVIEMLNLYLRKQAEIVQKHGGDIDKYVGDELMAIFEGNDAERRAVGCAQEIQRVMKAINKETEADIAIGIGINSGEVVSGNMGSADRIDHTVLGNHVNLAARLCSKAGRHKIIVSENTYARVEDKKSFNALEPIMVKGISEPVQIYDVDF
jgi:adenylate cyclase